RALISGDQSADRGEAGAAPRCRPGLTPDNGNEWMAAGLLPTRKLAEAVDRETTVDHFTPINVDFIEAGSVGPVVMLGPVAKSFQYLLTDPRQFDILQSGPSWRGANAIRSIETARVHHAARRRAGVAAARTRAAVRAGVAHRRA